MNRIAAPLVAASLCVAHVSAAQLLSRITNVLPVTIAPVISGNQLTAHISIAGLTEQLSITFEQAVGLSPNALAISVSVVNPLDPAFRSRVPSLVGVPTALPVVVRIDPTASSALSFSGVYTLYLHTSLLTFTANSPFRIYRAESGGAFHDMTGFLQMGSVRAGGSGPGFSEFLILADLRPTDAVISGKLQDLEAALSSSSSAIPTDVYTELEARLAQIGALVASVDTAAAIDATSAFGSYVKSQSGTAIPDVWRANGSLVNVAGTLRSLADTLRFSLLVKSNA